MCRTLLRLLVATTAVVAAAVIADAATFSATAGTTTAEAAGLPPLADQMRFRAELGVPASAEVVADLNERWEQGALPGATAEGAVFTADETAELDAREDAGQEIAFAARRYFSGARASAFGGVYIDHDTGRTVVLVTRDAAAHESALRARVSEPDRLTVRAADHALADLERVADAVGTAGGDVLGAAVDERANEVDVNVARDTPAVRAAVARLVRPGELPALRFHETPAPTFTGVEGLNAPPVKGGQRIITFRPDGYKIGCTSAFAAYAITRTDAGIFTTERYLLTAGHCDLERQAAAGWFQTEWYYIGLTDVNSIASGIDAMRIRLSRPLDRSQLVAITPTNDRYIYYRQSNTADVVGERTCMSGATTGGEKCGTLLVRSSSGTMDGIPLRGLRIASFDAKEGDSGGSVLFNSEAKGVVSCRTNYNGAWRMCYQHVHTALQYTGLTDVEGV
jgi:hypothetical protein